MKGAKIFSNIDLSLRYHQACTKHEDIHKKTLWTRYGNYELTIAPFNLTNAPITFMCLMNSVFSQYLDKFVLVFLDDILIYSKNEVDHKEHLRLVPHTFRED